MKRKNVLVMLVIAISLSMSSLLVQGQGEDTSPPNMDAGSDSTIYLGDTYYLLWGGSVDNVEITRINIDWGDGTVETFTEWESKKHPHVYKNLGQYVITLTGWDAAGNEGSDTVNVKVVEKPPSIPIQMIGLIVIVVGIVGIISVLVYRRRGAMKLIVLERGLGPIEERRLRDLFLSTLEEGGLTPEGALGYASQFSAELEKLKGDLAEMERKSAVPTAEKAIRSLASNILKKVMK